MLIFGILLLAVVLGVARIWANGDDEAIYVENWNQRRADDEK